MSVEYRFNSIVLRNEDIQEHFPELMPMINSYLQNKNTPKKRKPRKIRKTVAVLIDEIIDSLK